MLTTLFAVRYSDIGGPTLAARWVASKRKEELKKATAKPVNRKTRREIERAKEALVKEAPVTIEQQEPLPLPSLIPDIEGLLAAYDLLQNQIAEHYQNEARIVAENERLALRLRLKELQDEEDTLLAILLTI
jgi:hypothetical protein